MNAAPDTITILGSAAAEGFPSMFCDCESCRRAWANGGKDIRMRTAYSLGPRVRIDFGPDSLAQEYKFELHSERLEHLFFTHPHWDHMEDHLVFLRSHLAHPPADNFLRIYGSAHTLSVMRKYLGDFDDETLSGRLQLKLVELKPFEPLDIPSEDMTVWGLPADHMYENKNGQPFIYIMRCGGKYLLLANDTGFFREPVWEFLAGLNVVFSTVIADCCYGVRDSREGHMGGPTDVEVKTRLESLGRCVPGKTKFVVNHFSHNCGGIHSDFEAYFNPHGIDVGFDGMKIAL